MAEAPLAAVLVVSRFTPATTQTASVSAAAERAATGRKERRAEGPVTIKAYGSFASGPSGRGWRGWGCGALSASASRLRGAWSRGRRVGSVCWRSHGGSGDEGERRSYSLTGADQASGL
jgi:hypothetical protein